MHLSYFLALPALAAAGIISPPATTPAPTTNLDIRAATGNYTNTCADITLDANLFLHAWCGNKDHNDTSGGPVALLDLNTCIGYDGTRKAMIWTPNGNFGTVCKRCSVIFQGISIGCFCGGDATENLSFLDLNVGIANKNAQLGCAFLPPAAPTSRVGAGPATRFVSPPTAIPGAPNPIPTAPAAASILDVQTTTGNYTNTCTEITIDEHMVLHGSCDVGGHDAKGELGASLNLNECVAWDHETRSMGWSPNGKASQYCKDCDIADEGSILGCYCGGDGPDDLSLLDLDEGIKNKNGSMACVLWG